MHAHSSHCQRISDRVRAPSTPSIRLSNLNSRPICRLDGNAQEVLGGVHRQPEECRRTCSRTRSRAESSPILRVLREPSALCGGVQRSQRVRAHWKMQAERVREDSPPLGSRSPPEHQGKNAPRAFRGVPQAEPGQQAATAHLDDLAVPRMPAPVPQLTNDPEQAETLQTPTVEARASAAWTENASGSHPGARLRMYVCSKVSPRVTRRTLNGKQQRHQTVVKPPR